MKLRDWFIVIIFFNAVQLVNGQTKVAILDFENSSNISKYDGFGKALSNMLITDLKNSIHPRKMTFIERSQLNKILDEQRLQQTKNFDNNTTVTFGKLAGVKYVILGNVFVLDGICNISARMVNVETSEIEYSKESSGEISKWLALKSSLAEELSSSLNNPIEVDAQYKNLTTSEGIISQYTKIIEKIDEGDVDTANEMVDMLSAVQPEFKYFDELKVDIEALKKQVEQNTKDISDLSSALESELLDNPYQSANDFFQREEFDLAIKYFKYELERVDYWKVGKLLHLNYMLGLAYFNINQYKESLEFINTALNIYPHYKAASELKSLLLLKLNSKLFDQYADFHLKNIFSATSSEEYSSYISNYLKSKTQNRDSLRLIESNTGSSFYQGYNGYVIEVEDYQIELLQGSSYQYVITNYSDYLENNNRSPIDYIESLKKFYFESIKLDSYKIPKIDLVHKRQFRSDDVTNLTHEIAESKNKDMVKVQNLDLVYLRNGVKFENFKDFHVLRDKEGNYFTSKKDNNEFEYEYAFIELKNLIRVDELKVLLDKYSDTDEIEKFLDIDEDEKPRKTFKINYKLSPSENKLKNDLIFNDVKSDKIFLSYIDSILERRYRGREVDFGIEITSVGDSTNSLGINRFFNSFLNKSLVNSQKNEISTIFKNITRAKDSVWTLYNEMTLPVPDYTSDPDENKRIYEDYMKKYDILKIEMEKIDEVFQPLNDIFYVFQRNIPRYFSVLDRIIERNTTKFVYDVFSSAYSKRESAEFQYGTCDCEMLVERDKYNSLLDRGKIIGDYFVFNYDTNHIYDTRYAYLFFALGWHYLMSSNYDESIKQWDEYISRLTRGISKSENNTIDNFLQAVGQYNYSDYSEMTKMAIINRIHTLYLMGNKKEAINGYMNIGIESLFSEGWSGMLVKDVLEEDYKLFIEKGLISEADRIELFQQLGIL